MTDKVQEIREEVERLKEETSIGLSEHENGVEQGRMEIIDALSLFLDSLQEESVSKVWHYQKKEPVNEIADKSRPIIVVYGNNSLNAAGKFRCYEDNSDAIWLSNSYEKWAFVEDLINLSHSVTKVSWQEEPVSKLWHDASEETPTQSSNILMIRKKEKDTNCPPIAGCFHGTNSRLDGRNWGYYNGFCYNEIEPPVKWAYIDDILNFFNVERTVKNWKEPVSEDLEEAADKYESEQQEKYKDRDNHDFDNYRDGFVDGLTHTCDAFKAGAEWQKTKDESTTEDLGDYIYELSKQFPEVSFANLIRIAVRVAKWQKEHLWKPADGADLQEHDNEVIAILNNGKMVFAHRPPEFWDGKNIDTGKVTRYDAETYDKGGWNIPDVKWWLDFLMPKEIEL